MDHSLLKRQAFAPRCPAGGTWWSCGYGTFFVGCCARDPCSITCAQGNLYPGAFDASAYGTFPDATCGTGSKFYTCTANGTFWGCCKTNACSQMGCPDGDLEPAIMNRDDQLIAYHATGGSTTLTSATMTSTPAATSSTAATNASNEKDSTPVAAIVGGSVGGALAVFALIGILVYYCCFVKRSRQAHGERLPTVDQSFKPSSSLQLHQQQDAPPNYSSPNTALYPSYYAYNHPNPQPQPPQELPLSPMSSTASQKHGQSQNRGPSELSAETPSSPSELDTPEPSPQARHSDFKSIPPSLVPDAGADHEALQRSPGAKGRQSRFVELSPLREAGDARASTLHASPPRMKSAWVAPRDWGFRSPGSDGSGDGDREGVVSVARGPRHGLGVQGLEDMMARMQGLDEQSAVKKEKSFSSKEEERG